MSKGKRIIIIGGTSAMAEHCARLWVLGEAKEMVLVGRNAAKLNAVATDLRVRGPQAQVLTRTVNFLDPESIQVLVNELASKPVDIVLIAHGDLPDQHKCQQDLLANQQAQLVNGVSPMLFAEAFAAHMEKANHGTLAIIGSVAGDRGRKSNYIYGAAKGLVTRYAQGLQHRLAKSNVKVVLIKPGPTATPMTANLSATGLKMASVETVARGIVKGIARSCAVVYAPAKWRWIMMVIRHLPMLVFNKMNI